MSVITKLQIPDYRDFRNVGMAVNSGQIAEKSRVIELLVELELLSANIGLYVNGSEFHRQIPAIIGGLQRSIDSIEGGSEVSEDYSQPRN